MFTLLLIIIYIAFISLGLPDSLLGSAWPTMRLEFGAEISSAGIISMIISCGTVISALLSDWLNRKLGTGLVSALSTMLTALALVGFSFAGSVWTMCIFALPLGLGAGSIDAALNNYVALHYNARHMSWLHCFWGVGATLSPNIMSLAIGSQGGWRSGYIWVAVVQGIIAIVLFATLPMWKKTSSAVQEDSIEAKPLGILGAAKIKGVPFMLFAFFCYCTMEATTGLWTASFFSEYKGIDAQTAASYGGLFYIGLMIARFLNGFIADKLGDKRQIRYGLIIVLSGILLVLLPIKSNILSLAGLVIIGLGCAPIYPAIIHSTPDNFGKENSQAIVGIQMASAYLGCTLMPSVFGLIAKNISLGLFPCFLLIFCTLTFISTEKLNATVKHK